MDRPDDQALRTLLQRKEGRQGRELATVVVAVAVSLGLVQSAPPGPPEAGLVAMLGCLWLLHLVLIPTLVRPSDTTLLVTLRRGRCLEELAGAGLSPSRIVDDLGLHALHTPLVGVIGGFGLAVAPQLLGSLDLASGADLRLLGFFLGLALYPAFRVAGSYASQMLAAWGGESERVTLPQLAVSAAVHGPGNVLAVVGLTGLWHGDYLDGLWLLLALAYVALASRTLAILGLRRSDGLLRPEARPRARRPAMPGWLPPVLAREWLRDAVGLTGGIPAVIALNLLSLPVLLVWLEGGAASLLSQASPDTRLVGLPLLALLTVGTVRAASRTLDGCLAERESGTADLVRTTRLTTGEYLEQMAMLGWVPRVLEIAACLGLLLPFWIAAGIPVLAPLLLTLAVAAAMPMAAWLALLCVPASLGRRHSAILAHLCLVGVLWFGGFLAYVTDSTRLAEPAASLALVMAGVGLAVRFVALNTATEVRRS